MFTFKLSEEFLSAEEQKLFADYLENLGLDRHIWNVFESLFKCRTSKTTPLLLRVYKGSSLQGAAVFIKCRKYGRSLFGNRLLASLVDLMSIPIFIWIRLGCCMDMMSNPAFVRDPERTEEVISAMLSFMKKRNLLTLVNDYTSHSDLHFGSSVLPALPHGLIDISGMSGIEDYKREFKNIKRKIRTFNNKGGEYFLVEKRLYNEQITALRNCFIVTGEKSIFFLPYQDLYLEAALHTSTTPIEQVYYFVAMLNGQFLGYQAAIKTGNYLNALHGAFDRTRKTTFHAYDILFVKMAEFAFENGLEVIDFGVIVNMTKWKMVNTSIDMSYFIYSKYRILQAFFNIFLKITRIQGKGQMEYRNMPHGKETEKE